MRHSILPRCSAWSPLSALVASILVSAPAQAITSDSQLQGQLQEFVEIAGGPPGAIITLYRDGQMTVFSAGRADVAREGAPQANQHMRIASVAKAFNGAVALHLVQKGKLGLDDTIGKRLPGLPAAWSAVTIRQMLNHTGGLPDYTRSQAFAKHVGAQPRDYLKPETIIDWVRNDPLDFTPGSKYSYSNTDNIVVGLIAEAVTGVPYDRLLHDIVYSPADLTETSFPTHDIDLPANSIHGYIVDPGSPPKDVSVFLSPSGAWASGAIVSTPTDLAAFIRAYLGLKFFGSAEQQQQMQFVPGESSPPGPGANAAGLALFSYTTECGVVYGHTGNFPGYTQWAASTADGKRSVTMTLNMPAPNGPLLERLRGIQSQAVCLLLAP